LRRRDRHVDEQLPVDLRQVGGEGRLRREDVELRPFAGARNEIGAGGDPERAAEKQKLTPRHHRGRYPSRRSPKKKRAGARSISPASRESPATGWRISPAS